MLSEKELQHIASKSALSPKACHRLLGSLRIGFVDLEKEKIEINQKVFDIGLRLNISGILARIPSSSRSDILSGLLREYVKNCPVVTGWVARGDFRPEKRPERIGKAEVQHACRQAGRIRARGLRKFRELGVILKDQEK